MSDPRALIVVYQGATDEEPQRREIVVRGVEVTNAGRVVLRAYAMDRRRERTFRLDRITEAVVPQTGVVLTDPQEILDSLGLESPVPLEGPNPISPTPKLDAELVQRAAGIGILLSADGTWSRLKEKKSKWTPAGAKPNQHQFDAQQGCWGCVALLLILAVLVSMGNCVAASVQGEPTSSTSNR